MIYIKQYNESWQDEYRYGNDNNTNVNLGSQVRIYNNVVDIYNLVPLSRDILYTLEQDDLNIFLNKTYAVTFAHKIPFDEDTKNRLAGIKVIPEENKLDLYLYNIKNNDNTKLIDSLKNIFTKYGWNNFKRTDDVYEGVTMVLISTTKPGINKIEIPANANDVISNKIVNNNKDEVEEIETEEELNDNDEFVGPNNEYSKNEYYDSIPLPDIFKTIDDFKIASYLKIMVLMCKSSKEKMCIVVNENDIIAGVEKENDLDPEYPILDITDVINLNEKIYRIEYKNMALGGIASFDVYDYDENDYDNLYREFRNLLSGYMLNRSGRSVKNLTYLGKRRRCHSTGIVSNYTKNNDEGDLVKTRPIK